MPNAEWWTIKEASINWSKTGDDISQTTVKKLHYQGRIPGSTKIGTGRGMIVIPAGTPRPPKAEWGSLTSDQRAKWNRGEKPKAAKAKTPKTAKRRKAA